MKTGLMRLQRTFWRTLWSVWTHGLKGSLQPIANTRTSSRARYPCMFGVTIDFSLRRITP